VLSDACLLADPGDYSSANRYNVTFPFTDGEDPACNTLSSPIIIDLVDDDIVEDVEFFWARIAVTSDRLRVRFGLQDAIKVFITDDDRESETYSILSVRLESEFVNVEWRSQIFLSIIIM